MHLVTEQQTRQAMTVPLAARIIADTYRAHASGTATLSTPSRLALTGAPHRLGAKGAVLDDLDLAGMRLTSRTAPRTMLWRLSTGEPLALVDEAWLYRFRTGVSAAVVASLLRGGRQGEVISIIGAGPIAAEMAVAMATLLSPATLRTAARSQTSANEFVARMAGRGVHVTAAPTVAAAAQGADVVVTITTATEPFLHPDMIGRDTTVLSMGGGPELHRDLWTGAALRLVDDLDYACQQGDAAAWIAAGAIDRAGFAAELSGTVGELAAGHLRPPTQGHAVAIVQGLTALDIALAWQVVAGLPATS